MECDKKSNAIWQCFREKLAGSDCVRKMGARPLAQAPTLDSPRLARGSDIGHVDGAGTGVQAATHFDLLSDKLFGLLLVIQLVVGVAGLQHELATRLHDGSGEGGSLSGLH